MKYSVERTIKVKFRDGEYTVKMVMIPLRTKLELTDVDGNLDALKYYEASVPEVSGPDINDTPIKCGADILDVPGTDALFTKIMVELREWDVGDEELKNS